MSARDCRARTIVVRPLPSSPLAAQDNTIIGNTVLYGATAGALFAAGQAGERFAVRNSGADAVVEGLRRQRLRIHDRRHGRRSWAPVGDNFAAGMTGGMAFVHDAAGEFPRTSTTDTVIWQRIDSPHWEKVLRDLIAEHVSETQSRFAQRLINDWALERDSFWQIVPKEMLSRLPQPLSDREEEKRA